MNELKDCKCLDSFDKELLIELVDDAIENESEALDMIDEENEFFDKILEDRSNHEELLQKLRLTSECK